jgi:DNA-binding IclR family transcriptional regulator
VPGRIQSIERAAAILRLLSGRNRRLGVVQLAGELDLPKATVHGILRTLKDVGFVEQDPESGKYQLGAALLHMGSTYLDGNELRTRALNWSDSLAARSGESVRIGTLHEGQVLVVHHVFRPDDSRQALEVGGLVPAHATAMGKVLLAYLEPGRVRDLVARRPLERFTRTTVTDLDLLLDQLREVARRGYAVSDAEWEPGLRSLAAPVRTRDGRVVAAVCVIVVRADVTTRAMERDLLPALLETASAISAELGYGSKE